MSNPLPLSRTIVLTDLGAAAYTAALATYDGTPIGLLSLETTLASSSASVSAVEGAESLFTDLYARRASILARASTLLARRNALTARIVALES